MPLSRRRFARLAASAALAAPPHLAAQQAPLTAQQVIERIRANVGVPWRAQSLDAFLAGDPATPLTGIATTALATVDVLTRAAAAKANLIITLEPPFYARPEASLAGDPVFTAKQDFIRKHSLVLWRFSDHWRARTPDPFATGLAAALEWTRYQSPASPLRYDLPPVTLSALAADLAKRLDARAGIRVVGDPATRVRRIALLPGLSPLAAALASLPDADVLLAGETREWESVEYAQDTVASGQKKGMILLGRVLSQDPGMKLCADWLTPLVPELPVRWLTARDPYWRPA